VAGVVASQRFVLGPEVEALEEAIAARIGVDHAVGCASGTDAILLPLRALELEDGAEVVVPAFTFFATAGAVWNAGLRPVFADIDPVTFNLTRETLEAALTPRTRAVVVVHLFGQMAPMAPILELAEARGLAVIEDAAQSIDARQRVGGEWRAAGSVGRAGCLSFFPTKNLGAFGDGGMMTTSDPALAERLRKLRVHGGRQMYHHEMVGTNSRLDALQAAVLRAKLPHLEAWTEERRERAARYDAAFEDVAEIVSPTVMPGNEHVYNQYTVRVPDRDGVRRRLEDAGIGTGVYYPVPLHLQECFAALGGSEGDLPESERAVREVLSLPVYPELTEAMQQAVIDALLSAVRE
jgi:dTDP-4-amino-4,6-dideoxygalactose transaminase